MLFQSLFVSNTGLQAASSYLDVVSNNVANSSTTGYKTSQISFQDLLYVGPAAGLAASGLTAPQGVQLGSGTVTESITGLFTQGTLIPSTRPLDLAIDGQGFFAVTLPDGSTAYTRAGNLNIDANGQLVTTDGFLVQPAITVPQGITTLSIGPDGNVVAVTGTGIQTLGQITLTRFPNPGGLLRIGNTLFAATAGAGAPTTDVAGTNGLGAIRQGFLEQSNVELVTELVNLLVAQRAFQFNTRAIQTEDATLAATTALIT